MKKLGINGMGRIGRCVLRAYLERKDPFTITAINAKCSDAELIHLIKYDSTYGILQENVEIIDGYLHIGKHKFYRFKELEPEKIAWEKAGVEIVLECTGAFNSKEKSSKHLHGGVKQVIVSAPVADADKMIVMGVNEGWLEKSDKIISVGSCTTNCLAPILKVLDEAFGIKYGFMTTIHAYTADQNLLDNPHKDLRRARTAGSNIVPTSTGAAKSIGVVLPQLKGKLDGTSLRVPVASVSMVDLVFTTIEKTSKEGVNNALLKASKGSLKGIIAFDTAPLVSSDFIKRVESSIVDSLETYQVGADLFRIASWYDNEWGFSNRMLDVAQNVASL
ncbi:MAG: type I glyceraldehyde-3-phosphate dehydrogenase [Alphaproteobacteria bacterium]|jgi:glyceraldehyde 3-phosphate dehydrogenase